MGLRIDRAVAKASKARILADFRDAARLIESMNLMAGAFARGYAFGMAERSSLTVKASLLTAFGR